MGIFLTYDLQKLKSLKPEERADRHGKATIDPMQNAASEKYEVQVERFFNKEHNFSISWYPDVKALY